tara:strand:- start:1161 stop:1448 length:288 start_codon:yes stop_codon:yes gene_type:complete
MERNVYNRPREKLQYHGVTALTHIELLQLIIGSGTAHVSAAKIARQVAIVAHSQPPRLTQLLEIEGVGMAKACQLLAVYELAARQQKGRTGVEAE